MDDAYPADGNIESRIVEGMSALELGDLETARAALRDVYDVNPTHPALPLLAAGIRRIRPKQVPWRGIILLAAVVVLVLAGTRWISRRPALPAQSVAATTTAPAESASPSKATGTAGRAEVPAPPASSLQAAPTPRNDEVQIRQSITRFEGAYRSRWAPLTFSGCEIAHEVDTATATCRDHPRVDAVDGDAGRTWTFSLRKSGAAWRITSVQPSIPPE
jgi:hypothetical protein